MHDLSLTILDLAMNSIRANATQLLISIEENKHENKLMLTIKDNGDGFPTTQIKVATSPFYTTRETRKVGLGLPFFSEMISLCEGSYKISSSMEGTTLTGSMKLDHVNLPQRGNLASTIWTLSMEEKVEFEFVYCIGKKMVRIHSKTIQKQLKEEGKTFLSRNNTIYKQLAKELEILYGG